MSRFTVYVIPQAWEEIKDLPGNMRQRVKRAIDELAEDPYPTASKKLEVPSWEYSLYRLRLDRWRIVYAVTESDQVVDVLAIRRRPPYDYGDLEELMEEIS
jgi:mRNA interferase RelE/StbE